MRIFPKGSQSVLARVVAAEVRARLAAERISQRDFSNQLGFSSHNYLAIRLRDEKPFSLDDLERILAFYGEDAWEFMRKASDAHEERIWGDFNNAGIEESDRAAAEQTEMEEADLTAFEAAREQFAQRRELKHDPAAGSGAFTREAMSSFDEADQAARSEDTEKPRLD